MSEEITSASEANNPEFRLFNDFPTTAAVTGEHTLAEAIKIFPLTVLINIRNMYNYAIYSGVALGCSGEDMEELHQQPVNQPASYVL